MTYVKGFKLVELYAHGRGKYISVWEQAGIAWVRLADEVTWLGPFDRAKGSAYSCVLRELSGRVA